MPPADDLLIAFELHDPGRIRSALAAGASPVEPIGSKPPLEWLIEMYTRSPRFPDCLRVLLGAGASLADPLLEAILLDDDDALRPLLSPGALARTFHLECAYTSLRGVSPLHLCAEYNSLRCAAALLHAGAAVDTPAAIDDHGIGGHTPLFHAVNSNGNHCRPVMELLVDSGASLDLRLRALLWGGSFEWETVVFDVTPISYAQCGLYRQFHRREEHVYSNIDFLYRRRHAAPAPVRNVPNRYVFPQTPA
jgi:hypothetical protein